MNNFKTTLIIVTALFLSFYANAQKKETPCLDTLHAFIENKVEITLTACHLDNFMESFKNEINGLSKLAENNKPKFSSYKLYFSPGKNLSIKPSDPIEKIIISENGQTRYNFSHECIISSENYQMQINFNDMEYLSSDSFIQSVQKIITDADAKIDRFGKTYEYTIANNNLNFNENMTRLNGELDMIVLKLGLGAGLINNKPVTDISAEMGLQFAAGGIIKNEFYLSENMFFTSDVNDKLKVNTFMNLGYRRNFSKSLEKTNMVGIELGYLIKRNGDFFDKNTFKVGFNWEIGKYVSVAPQLYISDGFNKVTPGLRIGFGF